MYHDEIPERCKLNFTGIVDDAIRIAGELSPKQTLKKYIRKEVEVDTDGRVMSRRFEKKEKSLKDLNCLQETRLKVNSEREQDSPVEMGASNISRFKEMPFLKAKRHRAHSVVSGVRVKIAGLKIRQVSSFCAPMLLRYWGKNGTTCNGLPPAEAISSSTRPKSVGGKD
ncbi:hypothetical protein TNCV_28831 [Trichonephila clavipes]|nr:hypothetical protein TNCV_28831 [Trichonephila clavipes]